ncbi:GMC family oxidoreductase [Rhizobium leguminosarum]|uniref:GMC family oxidoreductase n=1 Tax=Rhizobium leguminosarum TaxID=384 RepID=UPI0013C1BDDC|nr:GMC family oxidoreductase N-terminal domain-containing protein [Rhizobium leguminosarum]NEH57921.1 GMC family oxidoreductase [Rhizobium leguminosarum]
MTHSYEDQIRQSVLENQKRLRQQLRTNFDFIVCGAGSSGSVVAGRLAEDKNVQVLLLEAGGDDAESSILDPGQWPLNLGSSRDWAFMGEPSSHLNGRRLPLNMGKVLGGGSSINVMVWARGHKSDWDYFAQESGDAAWGYESVLGYYRRIEDWHGSADPARRGAGGPVFVAQPEAPQPLAHATLEAARMMGIPTFESANGEMMEAGEGAAIAELRIHGNKRQSVFRSYTYPHMHQPNLTVLTGALVTRVILAGSKAVTVEAIVDDELVRFKAGREIVLSLGAVNTPKVLMQSGIGPEAELRRHGIPVLQDLPGVGENHQDHIAFGCTWEYTKPQQVGGGGCEAVLYARSDSRLSAPDIIQCQLEFAVPPPPEVGLEAPEHGWSMFAGLAQPKSRGKVQLSGPGHRDPVVIAPNSLSDPGDLETAFRTVELCRELGNSQSFRALVKREVIPMARDRASMESYIRNSAVTYWHQSCTARMGLDSMSVVDSRLRVYGIDNLRIADSSIMPKIPVGNTMAPCVVIGERAADLLKAAHGTNA